MEIPSAPIRKHPVSVKVAALADMPPFSKYFFAEGSMLYNDEKIWTTVSWCYSHANWPVHTMTPNERLNPVDRNALLSSILKFLLPGNCRMMRSTHIIEAVLC
jgi:hypothetical protein